MKNYSLQLVRKPNSHTKLPKLNLFDKTTGRKSESQNIIKDIKSNENKKRSQSQKELNRNLFINKLDPLQQKRSSKINILEKLKKVQGVSKQKINLKVAGSPTRNLTQIKYSKKQSNEKELKSIQRQTVKSDAAKSDSSSKQVLQNPVFSQIKSLLSSDVHNDLFPAKMYQQKLLGQCSAQWWCIVDSLFISLQKLVKVKRVFAQVEKKQKGKPQSPLKGNRNSPSKQGKNEYKTPINNVIGGTVLTKIKSSIEIAKVYSCLQDQLVVNQKRILKCLQDPSHITLILQALFYEKSMIYLLGSIRRWNHPQELLHIHSLGVQILPCIIQNRKLMIEILMQAVENQQQDNKIRKPKYIARQKKLIQISKFASLIKTQYEKCISNLGSPNRYRTFQLTVIKQYNILFLLQKGWRKIIFDFPVAPYLQKTKKSKEYLLVLEPLNILYKYNKKEELLSIDPYAQTFLKQLQQFFDIVFFTHVDKQSSLLNFMGILDKSQIRQVLDKHYITYKAAKPIKDIHKIGGGYHLSNILVIDDKHNTKYYCQERGDHILFIDGNHTQVKLARVGGKLVRMEQDNQNYLKDLSKKVMKYAQEGGHWDNLIREYRK